MLISKMSSQLGGGEGCSVFHSRFLFADLRTVANQTCDINCEPKSLRSGLEWIIYEKGRKLTVACVGLIVLCNCFLLLLVVSGTGGLLHNNRNDGRTCLFTSLS